MTEELTTIYCDESGATGNNLLDSDAPFFAFASVAISETTATEIVREAFDRFGIQGRELKVTNLLGTPKGREAISYIIEQVKDKAHLSFYNKPFVLACKFYEYVFEPLVSEENSFFYEIGFHTFLANLLHIAAVAQTVSVNDLLSGFQHLMWKRDYTQLSSLLAPANDSSVQEPLRLIFEFAQIHQDIIKKEQDDLSETELLAKWILELSTSALFTHLTHWGERYPFLEVNCDKSNALKDGLDTFDAMVITPENQRGNVFNLVKPIQLVVSRDHAGVQLADVLAGTLVWCLKNRQDQLSVKWLASLLPSVGQYNVIPDLEQIDLSLQMPVVNTSVLIELVERSRKGVDLLDGMEEYAFRIAEAYESERYDAFAESD